MPLSEPLAIGFDIGGSQTKIGLVNRRGKVIALRVFPTQVQDSTLESFLTRLQEEIQAVLNMAPQGVLGIGITFLGWINEARTGPFFCMNAPALHGFNLKGWASERFHLPVVVHDDVTAHTLAEYTFGSGRGARRFLCLAMGTGVGAGVIIDGEALQFSGGCAGDTGHLILRPGGPTCSSGCKGCAEALIGVAGIERLASERYGAPRPAHEVIRGAAKGNDTTAVEIMRIIGGYTGELLASLSNIFLPERIVLLGGTARAGGVLLETARQQFEYLVGDYRRSLSAISKGVFSGVEILLSQLKGETGVIGAVVDLFVPNLETQTTAPDG